MINALLFRAEFFNLFNRPNFGLPNRFGFTAIGLAGNAGAITTLTTSSRQIQFGLRYTFGARVRCRACSRKACPQAEDAK